MRRGWLWLGLWGMLGLGVQAAPVQGNLATTSSVPKSCLIQSADSIAFGSYAPINATAVTGQGQLLVTCTKGTAVTALPVSGGAAMSGSGGSLTYALYTSSSLSSQWGSPVAVYQSINLAAPLYFSSAQNGVSSAACAAQAAGMVYAYTAAYTNGTSYPSTCYTGYSATRAAGLVNPVYGTSGQWSGLIVGTTQKQAPYANGYAMIYLPTGSTLVSGSTYSAPTSMGSQAALSGTSTGVSTPVTLTYYGQVPGGQNVSAGVYTDTVVVQVSF